MQGLGWEKKVSSGYSLTNIIAEWGSEEREADMQKQQRWRQKDDSEDLSRRRRGEREGEKEKKDKHLGLASHISVRGSINILLS